MRLGRNGRRCIAAGEVFVDLACYQAASPALARGRDLPSALMNRVGVDSTKI